MPSSPYQKQLDELLKNLAITDADVQFKPEHDIKSNAEHNSQSKPTLLLHACCGPCSSYVLEYLSQYFAITVFYYNPNIYPQEEYNRRLSELKTFYTKFAPAANVRVVEEVYNPEDFYNAIQIHEHPERATEPEKGERCRLCYKFRLQKAYEYAAAHKYDYYCTTLSISPFKDAEKINVLGTEIAKNQQVAGNQSVPSDQSASPRWLPSDFKKHGGFQRSLELSSEYGLYRQQYCGCIYSIHSAQ
jgi:predicted adenine nucleotide alpha hydrolase (AANH) superfamily ATPase